ncbi:hypothetical protein ACQEVZ_27860 [Dactylosporangium sp. CA-152071]|uniref:hypothetical protein n=1 Tax=Dactylosporangium sp. CA-152071 TaxID=3239933 RepID=UPI003D8DF44A
MVLQFRSDGPAFVGLDPIVEEIEPVRPIAVEDVEDRVLDRIPDESGEFRLGDEQAPDLLQLRVVVRVTDQIGLTRVVAQARSTDRRYRVAPAGPPPGGRRCLCRLDEL